MLFISSIKQTKKCLYLLCNINANFLVISICSPLNLFSLPISSFFALVWPALVGSVVGSSAWVVGSSAWCNCVSFMALSTKYKKHLEIWWWDKYITVLSIVKRLCMSYDPCIFSFVSDISYQINSILNNIETISYVVIAVLYTYLLLTYFIYYT